MNCEELIRYLSDYIDNDLSEDLREDAEEHLATCTNCHIILDTTRKTILLYRQNGQQQTIPAQRRADLYERIQRAIRKQHPPPSD